MNYELNERQRIQIYAVLCYWKHVLFKDQKMPLTDELIEIFDKPEHQMNIK